MDKLVVTEDGSHTLYSKRFGEHYHSTHGAIQESGHIFIDSGLREIDSQEINILEIGLGTGLNAILSLIYAKEEHVKINYTSLELYPLSEQETNSLNYSDILGFSNEFSLIHETSWGKWSSITDNFNLRKLEVDLISCNLDGPYDLVYFDAFSPEIQPELWEQSVFEEIAEVCISGAVLTTYSVKGDVRRALLAVGFEVERIPGPPGKREILRARKKQSPF